MVMMTTVTNQNTSTPSRLSRLQDAKEYMVQHGWTPLTPEEEVEFHKMVAEFTRTMATDYIFVQQLSGNFLLHGISISTCRRSGKLLPR